MGIIGFVAFLGFIVLSSSANAANPSLSLYPATGYALLGKNFTVDIMLDTGGEDTTTARAVFRFDPEKLRVTKAEYAELYCQYPEDEYTVDNTLGWVKLTGFCLDPYYNSGSTAGLFGRITFVPLVEDVITLDFVETYKDDEWESMIMDAGSPPQEILGLQVSNGSYTVVSQIDGGSTTEKLPGVGLWDDNKVVIGVIFVAGALVVLVGGSVAVSALRKKKSGGDRTVIV